MFRCVKDKEETPAEPLKTPFLTAKEFIKSIQNRYWRGSFIVEIEDDEIGEKTSLKELSKQLEEFKPIKPIPVPKVEAITCSGVRWYRSTWDISSTDLKKHGLISPDLFEVRFDAVTAHWPTYEKLQAEQEKEVKEQKKELDRVVALYKKLEAEVIERAVVDYREALKESGLSAESFHYHVNETTLITGRYSRFRELLKTIMYKGEKG